MEENKNMVIYNAVREVPKAAQRAISAGRLKGKTDINPMWRIKVLTEQFGPCGFGWTVEVIDRWLDPQANGEVAAHIKIALRVKMGDTWSEPIIGLGGSMAVTNEKNGPYVSDECYKMAYTDAISVACKMLGIGADVYWDKDATKYTNPNQTQEKCKYIDDTLVNGDKKKEFLEWLYKKVTETGETPRDLIVRYKLKERQAGVIDTFLQEYETYHMMRDYEGRDTAN